MPVFPWVSWGKSPFLKTAILFVDRRTQSVRRPCSTVALPTGQSGLAPRCPPTSDTAGRFEGTFHQDVLALPTRFAICHARGPTVTRLLTYRGLLTRDSESFPARFRGPEGTLKVTNGPQRLSPKNSMDARESGFAVNPLGKATKRKTPNPVGARRSALTYGRLFVRRKVKSSSKPPRNWSPLVNRPPGASLRNPAALRPSRGGRCEFRFDQGPCWRIECDDATCGIPPLLGRPQRLAREV
jgi:hypothetical protein